VDESEFTLVSRICVDFPAEGYGEDFSRFTIRESLSDEQGSRVLGEHTLDRLRVDGEGWCGFSSQVADLTRWSVDNPKL
jgi:hypothetical protein